jgi:hypothetical protein
VQRGGRCPGKGRKARLASFLDRRPRDPLPLGDDHHVARGSQLLEGMIVPVVDEGLQILFIGTKASQQS